MQKEASKKRGYSLGLVFAAMAGILVLIGGVQFALKVIDKVRSGHGLDYYFTGWGVQFNYIGAFLLLFVIIPIALLIGYGLRWWQTRDERDFAKRYGRLPEEDE